MKKVYTLSDIENLKNSGEALPMDAILTPSAREALGSVDIPRSSGGKKEYIVPDNEFKWAKGSDPKTSQEIEQFFYSPRMQKLKALIVDLGKRSYNKNYNDGNGGNFSVRVGDNLVLCTPTMISKGFMTVEDMCLVDMDGVQLAGTRKRTSEVLAHIAIMKRQPLAKACCHAHPPHATAFAQSGMTPPRCVNPETEIFIGQVGLAKYGTPGTQQVADTIGETGVKHDCIFMVNHGVITWANEAEISFWKMENVEAHCQASCIAFHLGGPRQFTDKDAEELMKIRRSLGMVEQNSVGPEFRNFKECKMSDTPEFRQGCVCTANPVEKKASSEGAGFNKGAEDVVTKVTQMIVEELKKK